VLAVDEFVLRVALLVAVVVLVVLVVVDRKERKS